MHLEKLNPANALAGVTGFGSLHSSAACNPEHTTPALIINRLQRQFAISELHAATVAHLAGLGPMEARHGR
ncbi:MAG: hypothetical protein C0447_00275 [Methylobacterium sp.]|nr:hypothetical protein [Methylobacterium sp.]